MSDKNRKLGIVIGNPDLTPLYVVQSNIESGIKEISSLSIQNLSQSSAEFNIFSKQIYIPYTGIDRRAYLDSTNLTTYLSSVPSGPGVRIVGDGLSLPSGGLNNPVISDGYWEAYSSSSGVFVWLGPQTGYERWSGTVTGRGLGTQISQWNNSINFYKINPTGNNIVEVSNKPIIITASGNWGGHAIEWQSSPNKINWSNFNLSQIPRNRNSFPSIGGYFVSEERSIPDIINVVSGGNTPLNREYLNIGIWSGFSGMFCPTIGGYNVKTLYSGLNNGSWDRLALLRFEYPCNSLNSFGGPSGTWALSHAYLEDGFYLKQPQPPGYPPVPPIFIPYPTTRWRGDTDNYYYVRNNNSHNISEVDLEEANWQASFPSTINQLPVPKFIPFYRRSRSAGQGIYIYSGQLPSGHKYLRLRDPAGILGGGSLNVSLTYFTPDESQFESEWPKPCEYFAPTILASEFPGIQRIDEDGNRVPKMQTLSSSVSTIYNTIKSLNNTGVLQPINLFGKDLLARYAGTIVETGLFSGNYGFIYSKNNFSLSNTFSVINPTVTVIGNISGRFQYTVANEGFNYEIQYTRNLNSGWLYTGILPYSSSNQTGIASGFTRMEYLLPLTELAGGNLFFRVRVQAIEYLNVGSYAFYETTNDRLLYIFDDVDIKTYELNLNTNEMIEYNDVGTIGCNYHNISCNHDFHNEDKLNAK